MADTKYMNCRSKLGKMNETRDATARGNRIQGNTSHLVLLICDTINRHCKKYKKTNINIKFNNYFIYEKVETGKSFP